MELLVWAVDKGSSNDPNIDRHLYKAGDVIDFKPDGSDWGLAEISNPDWRIISVPGLSLVEARSLVASEIPNGFAEIGKTRRRGLKIDLTALHDGTIIEKQSHPDNIIDAKIELNEFRKMIQLKPRR